MEVYFLLLMQNIEKNNNTIDAIKKGIEQVKKCNEYKGLNFILTNGKEIYAYRDANNNKEKYSLYYLKRIKNENPLFESKSEKTKQILSSKLLNNEKAILICSEKLTDEKWILIELNKL